MDETKRLYGLRAVVTGAANGIGEAIARTYVKHGAEVLAVDAPAGAIDKKLSSIRGISVAAIDPMSADSAAQIIKAVSSKLGRLDIVVNNYITPSDRPIVDGDDDALAAVLERKLTLMSRLCEAALPLLKKSPAGRIINIGFVRSSFARDGDGAYVASQKALYEFTSQLAAKCGEFGITANVIQPGAIMTPDSRDVFNKDKALRDYCIKRSAAKRLGEPIDIAKVALFLASDESVFVSGTGIIVDGGIANAPGT